MRELIVVIGSMVLVTARWLPAAVRRQTAAGGAAVVLIGTATLLPEPRWQMFPVLTADLLTGIGWLLARRRTRWWLALPATLACFGLIIGGGVAAWALPVPVFPTPSGPSPVGTTVTQWTDPGRDEPGTLEADDRRTVVVQLWYPAREAGSRARYLGRTREEAQTVADGEARYLGVPAAALSALPRAHSHAAPGAPPADGRFPVVLFSPGLGGVRSQNTAWAEDLASRGYLVAGVDHPFDSAAVVLTDGRTVPTAVAATGDRGEDDRRRARWTEVRAADLRFVLSRLADPGSGPIAGRADTRRVAAAGHSIGGAAAMRAAEQDRRITAVINMDGGLNRGQRSVRQPVLALTHDVTGPEGAAYLARLTSVLDRGVATSYRLTVPGSAHVTFTDAPLFLPPVPSIAGTLGRAESIRMTTQTTAAFLDATLRGRPIDLPAELARHGDLHVHGPAV
ncbi:hypothetical protein [Actinoplanes sp. DH11]|uniref:alpha/beta hydrolase family protein n=1 Tax=Actinoplanes sp. DH11 TaxID=2857011 RepID=UPI001E59B8E3|nr:hypothetical protein [Actinoplanes sp. DH11]